MNLVDRAKNIILTPKTEWPVIAGETPNIQQIIVGYVIPLALIPAVATILGGLLFVHSVFFSVTYYIGTAIAAFVAAVIGVFVTAYVIDFLAPNFGSEKGLGRAMQLVSYSFTPAWIAGVLNIIPFLGIIGALAGLYGIYLLYLGLPVLMKTPQDKVVIYLVVTIIVLLVVYFVLAAVFSGGRTHRLLTRRPGPFPAPFPRQSAVPPCGMHAPRGGTALVRALPEASAGASAPPQKMLNLIYFPGEDRMSCSTPFSEEATLSTCP
jgi:hypothetical protein